MGVRIGDGLFEMVVALRGGSVDDLPPNQHSDDYGVSLCCCKPSLNQEILLGDEVPPENSLLPLDEAELDAGDQGNRAPNCEYFKDPHITI